MDEHIKNLLEEYDTNICNYEKILEIAKAKVREFVSKENVTVSDIQGRVKTRTSLEGKLELKGYKYQSTRDITDLVGIRVVTYYLHDVDKIAAIIEKNFHIDWENSIDKRKVLDYDQFGYMSLHYICQIPKNLYEDPLHPEINEIRFEIQMRTSLQNVWATANHDTGYKSNIEIPKKYKRAFTRLSGLLELADEQFDEILASLEDYRRKVSSLIKDGDYSDLEINGDTFKSYLEINPFKILNEKIASINNAEIAKASFAQYLQVFKDLDFKTLNDIENLKKEHSDSAYNLAVLQISGTDLDILSETIGLQNLCIVYIIKSGLGIVGLTRFYDVLYGKKARNESLAERMIERAKSINIL